jgi:signal transduction histidine kinase/ActR/RegA family two-component response regulator
VSTGATADGGRETHDQRVLIRAPTTHDGELASDVLVQAGVYTAICDDADVLCAQLDVGAGAILIAEEALDDTATRHLCAALARQPRWSDVPLVLLARSGSRIADAASALDLVHRLGNVVLLEQPVAVPVLLTAIRTALRVRARQYELRDHIAEVERSEGMLQRARADAEAANRAKDEFLAMLSHELRSPLGAINTWAHLLRTGRLDAAKTTRALEAIERSARAQAQIVEDLLDVSRIVTGKLRLDLQAVQMATLIEGALDTVRPQAEAKGVELVADVDHGATAVDGDPDRLEQVVNNLLSNAVKFTPDGGRVSVRLATDETDAHVTVTDTGKGIHPDVLPLVFERFRQGDSAITRAHGGLGLGLAIVRHLVERHGGRVRADSEGEGRGASFTISLPLSRHAISTAAADGAGGAPIAESLLRGATVLVVDDDPLARESLAAALEQYGATTLLASSASAALDALDHVCPDAMVSDIAMPGEDGYSLIRRVRERPASRGGYVPAVALTAYAGRDHQVRALLAGFQAHVAKPFLLDRLVAVLCGVMGERRSRA